MKRTDLIFHNGHFRTMAEPEKMCSTVAVRDGRIVAIAGEGEAFPDMRDRVRMVDLKGRTILPGFIDCHLHLLRTWYKQRLYIDLARCRSVREIQEAVVARIDDVSGSEKGTGRSICGRSSEESSTGVRPAVPWIFGLGWNQQSLVEQRFLTRIDLDEVSATVPVALYRVCQHVCVVNSAALEIIGLSDTTPDPPGGRLGRDAAGRLTGLLEERAVDLVRRFERLDSSRGAIRVALLEGSRHLAAMGITTAQTDDFSFGYDRGELFHVLKELDRNGELPIRLLPQLRIAGPEELQFFLGLGIKPWEGSKYLKFGQIKMILDGSLGARTAALREPYNDDPYTRGMLMMPDHMLQDLVGKSFSAGYDVLLHAIGDRAMDQALRVYGTMCSGNGCSDHPLAAINHCQVAAPNLIRQFTRFGVWANIQPAFINTDISFLVDRVGPERAHFSYAWKRFRDAGVPLVGSSDAPVEPPDPLAGICAAVTGREESVLSVRDAVSLFTRWAAAFSHEESVKGTIEQGKWADFVVLSADPFTVAPELIGEIEVEETWVGGVKVFPHSTEVSI